MEGGYTIQIVENTYQGKCCSPLIVSSFSITQGMFMRETNVKNIWSDSFLLAIPYAYNYSEVSEVTNIIFSQTLRCLLYHFSKIPLRSVLYQGHRLIDVESILIEQLFVYLAPIFVECGWISLFSSASI